MKKGDTFPYYLRDHKEEVFHELRRIGFSQKQAEKLRYSFYEIELNCKFDGKDIKIVGVQGHPLKKSLTL